MRVKEGQKVKRDEIIAVLSNYPKAEEALRKAEANLTRLKQQHDTVLMGTRVTNIALQEATLKSSIESDKLQTVQRARFGNGTIMRVGSTVNRMQRVEPDGAASTDACDVQLEIQFDDRS